MRLLAACSLGGAGHLHPMLAFVEHPRARDEWLVAGPPGLADMVRVTGVAFWPGEEPLEAETAPIRDRLALAPADEASVLGNRELFGRMATTAMLPEMTRLFDEWRPDFVLRDPCEFASAVLARRTGTHMAQVAISFADVEAGSIQVASPALEDHERGLTDALIESPYLTRFPESLDPSPFPSTVRYRAAARVTAGALPDWWHGSDAPLVYVTLGTVLGSMSFAVDVFEAVLEAVRSLDARVLLTVGRHFDPARLGPVPAHVHVERWVDQEVVLRTAALVVCHGGSGTVLGALEAAVPLVVIPSFADQFENGRRVTSAGAGRVVSTGSSSSTSSRRPPSVVDAPMIAGAVATVLGDASARAGAARVAAEMRAAPLAIDALATLLEPTAFGD
jgi:hypothetical protein